MKTETCYQTLYRKIKCACSPEDLDKIDKLTTKIYDLGQLTPSELKRLDLQSCDKRIDLQYNPAF